MELAELTALLTPEGLRLVDDLGAIDGTDDVAATVSRLRAAGLSPDLVAAAVGQARLRITLTAAHSRTDIERLAEGLHNAV